MPLCFAPKDVIPIAIISIYGSCTICLALSSMLCCITYFIPYNGLLWWVVPVLQIRVTSCPPVYRTLDFSTESPVFWETPQIMAKPDSPEKTFHQSVGMPLRVFQ